MPKKLGTGLKYLSLPKIAFILIFYSVYLNIFAIYDLIILFTFFRPFFVGNPRLGRRCKPCREFCNSHTDICFDQAVWNSTSLFTKDEESAWPHIQFPDLTEFSAKFNGLKGPLEENAVCANCQDHTTGLRCDHCKIGYFGGASNGQKFCQPCLCNGHGDICDEVQYMKFSVANFS